MERGAIQSNIAFDAAATPKGVKSQDVETGMIHPAVEYLKTLFKPRDILCLTFIEKSGDTPRVENIFIPLEQAISSRVIARLTERNATQDIYVSMSPFPKGTTQRLKIHVVEARHAFVDCDENGDAALEALRASVVAGEIPKPAFIVQSSPSKYQAIWNLVDGYTVEQAESLNKALVARFGADPHATDIARVLRLPGFVNLKPKYDKPVCEIIQRGDDEHGTFVSIDAFKISIAGTQNRNCNNGNNNPLMAKTAYQLPEAITEGNRNGELFKFGSSLRAKGADSLEILIALQTINDTRCVPALELAELKTITGSIMQYQAGASRSNPEGSKKNFPQTELGLAERMLAKDGDNICFDHDQSEWFTWNGKVWISDNSGIMNTKMVNVVRDLIQEASALAGQSRDLLQQASLLSDENQKTALILESKKVDTVRDALMKWERKAESYHIVENAIKMARPFVPVHIKDFDKNLYLFSFQNGVLDLKTGDFREHRRDDKITKMVPYDYDPAATAPLWKQCLIDWHAGVNESTIAFLNRAAGYSLTGFCGEQCLFLPYGPGANGKSAFLNAMRYVMGAYAMQADWQSFSVRKHGGGLEIREDIARLAGARFVAAVEAAQHVRLAENIIKAITGEDTITARHLYKGSFEFVPQFKLWLATNYKPKVIGTDEAIWRRIHLIPFDTFLPNEKRDKNLGEKLKAEAAGIFNCFYAGLQDYWANGLRPPEQVVKATQEYRNESNTVKRFIDTATQRSPGEKVGARDLYEAYKNWLTANGEQYIPTAKDFKDVMEVHGLKQARFNDGLWWVNIAMTGEVVL